MEDVREIQPLPEACLPYVVLLRLKDGPVILGTKFPTKDGQFFEHDGEMLERVIARGMADVDAGLIPPQADREKDPPATPAKPAADQPAIGSLSLHEAPAVDAAKKPKRSTRRGDGQVKLNTALSKHHNYAEGGCLNLEPIGNNDLARAADVSASTASLFFRNRFHGHEKYRALCRHSGALVAALKLLNGEFSPHYLYGGCPATKDGRDDE
jgi:hypothetical protein